MELYCSYLAVVFFWISIIVNETSADVNCVFPTQYPPGRPTTVGPRYYVPFYYGCQNNGVPGPLGICYCEWPWIGADCSIINHAVATVTAYNPAYSYINSTNSAPYWNTTAPIKNSAYNLLPGKSMWARQPLSEYTFTLSVTLQLSISTGSGAAIILAPILNGNVTLSAAGNHYTINWSKFYGIAVRFSPNCNGVLIAGRTVSNGQPIKCSETVYNTTIDTFYVANWAIPNTIQAILTFTSGKLTGLDLCTISSYCITVFKSNSLNSIPSLFDFAPGSLYIGVGSGNDTSVNVYEVRYTSMDYIEDYSYMHGNLTNWIYYRNGSASNPPGALQLISSSMSNTDGAMWNTKTFGLTSSFEVDTVVNLGAQNASNSSCGFAIFIAANASIQRPSKGQYGINTQNFTGLAIIVSKKTSSICVQYAKIGSSFVANCNANQTIVWKNVTGLKNTLRLNFEIMTNSTSSYISVQVYLGSSTTSVLPSSIYNLRGLITNLVKPYLGIGAYCGAKTSVDVYQVMVTTSAYCSSPCQNGGYCLGDTNTCVCPAGFGGGDCSWVTCSPDCSTYGSSGYCYQTNICVCYWGWSNAPYCNVPVCNPDCPLHAFCTEPGICTCIEGWLGSNCDLSNNSLSTPSIGLGTYYNNLTYVATTAYGYLNTNWNYYYNSVFLDNTTGFIINNEAIRLIPQLLKAKQGAMWTTSSLTGTNSIVIRATIEIGRRGNGGDGFAIILTQAASQNSSTYTISKEYNIQWSSSFKGSAFIFQPANSKTCVILSPTGSSSLFYNCSSGNSTLSKVYTSNATILRQKFQVVLRIIPSQIQMQVCTVDDCTTYTYNLTTAMPTSSYIAIAAQSSNTKYDSVDVHEILIYKATQCASCNKPNAVCLNGTLCACADGWTGTNCTLPYCDPTTLPTNAICVAAYTWQCRSGWTGYDCSVAICPSGCPMYAWCATPGNCTCIWGLGTSPNCLTSPPLMPFADAIPLPSYWYWNSSSLSKFNVFPLMNMSNNGAAVRVASAYTSLTGSMFTKTSLPVPADFVVNATIEERKTNTYNGYYGIFLCTHGSLIQNSTNMYDIIDWPNFVGIAISFSPQLNQSCIVYAPSAQGWSIGCTYLSTEVLEIGQKLRIGVVIRSGTTAWVDVCSIKGCQIVFSNQAFADSSIGLTTITAGPLYLGIGGVAKQNGWDIIDVHELLVHQLPLCLNPCKNGGNCSGYNICNCTYGWNSSDCSIPICHQPCLNGGSCTAPDTCTCTAGWTSANCSQPICAQVCANGATCTAPNNCTCVAGWTGSNCTTPICSPTCKNGGTCSAPSNCTCTAGYIGLDCGTPFCPQGCLNGGNCTLPFTCTCAAGWYASNCSTANCTPSCLNGGSCVSPNVCTCAPGWTGPRCATPICQQTCVHGNCTAPNTCTCSTGWTSSNCSQPICSQVCANGAICSAPNTCTCAAGWTSSNCTIPICSQVCKNGATCSAPNNCTCVAGYIGLDCGQPYCPHSCLNGGNCTSPYTCTCVTGWYGSNCSMANCTPSCLNGGTCSAPNVCTCAAGWTGPRCATPICTQPCLNGGTCTAPNTCTCASGWTSPDCSIPICSFTCTNGGTCSAPNICTCAAGWTGITCATPICSPTCKNGGTCIAPGNCTCVAGWQSSDCSVPYCPQTCLHGGTCSSPYTCTCVNGWYGTDCSLANCSSPCLNGGNCSAPNTCTCAAGWTGATCATAQCAQTCLNGGLCAAPGVCSCAPNWAGWDCSNSTLITCTPICSIHGTCTATNVCTCVPGWTGQTCTAAICSQTCSNGGNCTSPNTCTCASGWIGSSCTSPVCDALHTCVYGNCTSPNACTCVPGWTGPLCSQPMCSQVCANNGTCVAPDSCSCSSGWAGTDCTTPVCGFFCNNGGTCVAPNTCNCVSGWTGTTCNTAICNPSCMHGGTCTGPDVCSCATGWTDATCSTPICSLGCGHGNCTWAETCTCDSGWTGATCSTPICDVSHQCVHGHCSAPNTCTCNSGWTDPVCSTAICTVPCANNGSCLAPDTCTCTAQWTDSSCSSPVCSPSCSNGGTCIAPNSCSCPSGWASSDCSAFTCSATCQNGACTGPNTCTCSTGWTGDVCDTAICSFSCNNGNCTSPDHCNCYSGWTGTDCTSSFCTPSCSSTETCVPPGVCVCQSGWTATSCSSAICSPSCVNGACVAPDNCSCSTGWDGAICNIPICTDDCVSGKCTAPDTCTCYRGWTGPTCSDAICKYGCNNGGNCSSPGTCTCQPGWIGRSCSSPVCADGCGGGGTCIGPGLCSCLSGWTASDCSLFICEQDCPDNTTCTGPNICSCSDDGWDVATNCTTPSCGAGCLNGGTCSAPNVCSCLIGFSGEFCEYSLCAQAPCQNGGSCVGNDTCNCLPDFTGLQCETLWDDSDITTAAPVDTAPGMDYYAIVRGVARQAAGSSAMIPRRSVVSTLPQVNNSNGLINNYFDPSLGPVVQGATQVASDGNLNSVVNAALSSASGYMTPTLNSSTLQQQSELLSQLNSVANNLGTNGLGDLTSEQYDNLTTWIDQLADQIVYDSVSKAISVQSAVVDTGEQFRCEPLIFDIMTPPENTEDALDQLVLMYNNFTQTVEGIIGMLLRSKAEFDSPVVMNGKFHAILFYRTRLATLSGLKLTTKYGSAQFPTFASVNTAKVFEYAYNAKTKSEIKSDTPCAVVVSALSSSILDSNKPYNFPNITVRMYDENRQQFSLIKNGQTYAITMTPTASKGSQYTEEKALAQCDSSQIACDITTNSDNLGSLLSYTVLPGQGDFLMSIQPDSSFPAFTGYINFRQWPSISKYLWTFSVTESSATISTNVDFPFQPHIAFQPGSNVSLLIPGEDISLSAGSLSQMKLYIFFQKDFSKYSPVASLPPSACMTFRVSGMQVKVIDLTPETAVRKRRQHGDPTTHFDLEANSTELAVTFHTAYFSSYGANLVITPNTIEFSNLFAQFSKRLADNSAVFALIISLIIMFLVLLVWEHFYDKSDLKRWAFLPITSNLPHEEMNYLISVHCGSCQNYKLGPLVDIRLFGDVTNTDWRRLDDGVRLNFKSCRPSNFILTTYHTLGRLESIAVGVKSRIHTEKDPLELNIDKVIVVDVASGRKYIFLVKSKFRYGKTKIVRLATKDEIIGLAYLLTGHSGASVTDSNLWLSIFKRPIPSTMTRCERVGCAGSALFLALLVNAMFYGQDASSPRVGIQIGNLFCLSWFTVYTGLAACFIIVPPVGFMAFIFQRVRRRSAEKSEWITIFNIKVADATEDKEDDDLMLDEENKEIIKANKKKLSKCCWCFQKLSSLKLPKELPYFMMYIAWILVSLCISVSSSLVIMYSLAWGSDKSYQWISSVLFQIIEDAILIQMAKAIVVSLFNSGKLTVPDDGVPLGKLTFPKGDKLQFLGALKRFRGIATGIGHHALYVLTFALVIGATRNDWSFIQVKSLRPQISVNSLKPLTDLVPDFLHVFFHLEYKIVPTFMNGNQLRYGLNFPSLYQVPNHDLVSVGAIRLRQQRAGLAPCLIQSAIHPDISKRFGGPLVGDWTGCHTDYIKAGGIGDSSEQRAFNLSWLEPLASPSYNESNYQAAWTYKPTDGSFYTGEYGTYQTGGYFVELPTKMVDALLFLDKLRLNRWLDTSTSVLFVEFVLFNPQLSLIIPTKIIFESLGTGGSIYQVRVKPMELYQYGSVLELFLQSLWIFCLISHIVKLAYQGYKQGFRAFWKNYWNYLDIMHLSLGVIIVILFISRMALMSSVTTFIQTYPDKYLDMDLLISWEDLMFGLYGFAFFFAMMAFFRHLSVNKQWATLLKTLSLGKQDLLSYTAFFLMVTLISAAFLYLLVGRAMMNFSTYKASFLSLIQCIVGPWLLTKLGFPDKFSLLCSLLYSSTVLFCGAHVFITILTNVYGKARSNPVATSWDAELAGYMSREFKKIVSSDYDESDPNRNMHSGFSSFQMKFFKAAGARTYKRLRDQVNRFLEVMNFLAKEEQEEMWEAPDPDAIFEFKDPYIRGEDNDGDDDDDDDGETRNNTVLQVRSSYSVGRGSTFLASSPRINSSTQSDHLEPYSVVMAAEEIEQQVDEVNEIENRSVGEKSNESENEDQFQFDMVVKKSDDMDVESISDDEGVSAEAIKGWTNYIGNR